MDRPGRADVEVVGPRDDIRGVRVSGTGVVVVRGHLDLADPRLRHDAAPPATTGSPTGGGGLRR